MLAGKVVAVTGAGRGIGRAVALLCAREGAAVIVNDPGAAVDGSGADPGPAQSVVAEIRSSGGKAVANIASVADSQGAASIIADAVAEFGRIDGVVNAAGILRDRMIHKMSDEDWRGVIDVHLHGSFAVARAAIPHFRAQGAGAFVHFTSAAGLVGNLGQANYAAAKLGIVGLSRSLALEGERCGVRSNCIAPIAWSRMMATVPPSGPGDTAAQDALTALSPDKVAPLAAVLLSDAAATVSGQIFSVQGDEIAVFSQPRPVRAVRDKSGWTALSLASHALPALESAFTPLETAAMVVNIDRTEKP